MIPKSTLEQAQILIEGSTAVYSKLSDAKLLQIFEYSLAERGNEDTDGKHGLLCIALAYEIRRRYIEQHVLSMSN